MFLFFLTFKDVPNVLNLPRLIVAKEKIHKSLQPPLPPYYHMKAPSDLIYCP